LCLHYLGNDKVDPAESKILKCPAVPVPVAVLDQVPLLALEPPLAAAIQSEGSVNVANKDPELAVAQVAGGPPVQIVNNGAVEIVVSN